MSSARIQEMFSEGVSRNRIPSQCQFEMLLPEHSVRLERRGVTVITRYEEYCQTHLEGYRNAGLGYYLMCYRMVAHAVGYVEYYVGDQIYMDFAGDKLKVVDRESVECYSIEGFVAILGAVTTLTEKRLGLSQSRT